MNIPKLAHNLDAHFIQSLNAKIDQKTKPVGALGLLESLAKQLSLIQQTLSPTLSSPHMLVFAGDHGIANESVSAYPQAVTAQMVGNFLTGGAAINVFTQQHGLAFKLVDAGVNHTFDPQADLLQEKIAFGTRNFLHEPAMSAAQCVQAIAAGERIMSKLILEGCNIVGFGEMGIANTTSASALMATLTDLPLTECIGRGTGLDTNGLSHKHDVLTRAIRHHQLTQTTDPYVVLATFGGFETAMMVGAMLTAAKQGCTLIIDGFIVSSALLVAHAIAPNILDYCVFSHCSDEKPHQALLAYLNTQPLLNLSLRLGEGSGAALAYPIIESAVLFLNNMASFESAQVSQPS